MGIDEEALQERLDDIENRVVRLERGNAKPARKHMEFFEGKDVRTFLPNGIAIRGKVHFDGDWVSVTDANTGREALCNLQHVVSMTTDCAH